jgi:tetratricopeptide (TPR) repeat protein
MTAAVDGWAARLNRVDRALADLRSGAKKLTRQETSVRLAALLNERANLSGSDADAAEAEDVVTAAMADGSLHTDLILTLAQLHTGSHDLARATAVLDQLRDAECASAAAIRAGILRQRGELVGAAQEHARLIRASPTWEHLAGLAGVYDDLGDVETADALYALAADDIDALHMGAFAWVEVQRAQLWLRHGELACAERHITCAEIGFGGWRVCEQRARWLTASGRDIEAVESYRRLAEMTERPNHLHAFGDALARVGRQRDATAQYHAARYGYLTARSPARYRHHLAEFCLEVTHDVDEALALATQDYAERPNRRAGQFLAAVLVARGETSAASLLTDRIDARCADALTELRDASILECISMTP